LMDVGNGAENAVDFIEDFYTGRTWDLHATREIQSVLSKRETTPVSDSRMLFMLENSSGFAFDYSLSLAKELKKSGHLIGFLFSSEAQSNANLAGIESFHSSSLLNQQQMDSMSPELLKGALRNRIMDDGAILRNFNPTHIIDGGRIGARIVCSKHSGEYFQLFTGEISQIDSMVDPLLESSTHEFLANGQIMFNEDHPILFPGTPSLFQQVAPKLLNGRRIVYLGAPRGNDLKPDFEFPSSLYLDKTVIVILLEQSEENQQLIKKLQAIADSNTIFFQFIDGKVDAASSREPIHPTEFLYDHDALTAAMKLSDVVIHDGNFAHLQLAMSHCNPAIIIPSNNNEEVLAHLVEQNGWGHSVSLSSENAAEECLEFMKTIVSNRSSYQKNMKSMCKELDLWNNGGMRGAYAINLTCKKPLAKLEEV
jgi:UDP:flavonoid glycosyltransferase YjiC (YdhE family)